MTTPRLAVHGLAKRYGETVALAPFDLTSGLLGVTTWGINGYDPASAEGLVRNVIFWAMDGRP